MQQRDEVRSRRCGADDVVDGAPANPSEAAGERPSRVLVLLPLESVVLVVVSLLEPPLLMRIAAVAAAADAAEQQGQ